MKRGKWKELGFNKCQYRHIYESIRIKAFLELKSKHKREYSKIMRELIRKRYKQSLGEKGKCLRDDLKKNGDFLSKKLKDYYLGKNIKGVEDV